MSFLMLSKSAFATECFLARFTAETFHSGFFVLGNVPLRFFYFNGSFFFQFFYSGCMDSYPLFEDGSDYPTTLRWIFVDSVPTDQEDTIEECEFEFVEYQLQTKHVPIYKLDVSQKSVLARIASTSHDLFLRRKPKTRTEYLNGMTYLERMLFEKAVLFRNPDSCLQILTHKQKSHRWLWSRQGRITGSVSGSCVGQNPYCRVLKSAWESV